MTHETNAAIEGALEAGAVDILVRDSHGSARNILPELLNRNAKLLRDWSGGFMSMMEGIDETFVQKISPGDIIIAGQNFGCGSSREHAPWSIKEAGISCVIAKTFARIFFRNAINIGLPIIESQEAAKEIQEKDIIEVDLDAGKIVNHTQKKEYHIIAYPKFMQTLITAGGLLNYIHSKGIEKNKR